MLKEDDLKWFAERLDTSGTGRVIVPSYLVKKYRRLTGDLDSDAAVVRSKIVYLCECWI